MRCPEPKNEAPSFEKQTPSIEKLSPLPRSDSKKNK